MFTLQYFDYTIQVGQDQNENQVLLDTAQDNDYWVHMSDFPSAHGIIYNPYDERISLKVIKRCCLTIKENSKQKSLKKLAFDITKRKFLQTTNTLGLVTLMKTLKIINI